MGYRRGGAWPRAWSRAPCKAEEGGGRAAAAAAAAEAVEEEEEERCGAVAVGRSDGLTAAGCSRACPPALGERHPMLPAILFQSMRASIDYRYRYCVCTRWSWDYAHPGGLRRRSSR